MLADAKRIPTASSSYIMAVRVLGMPRAGLGMRIEAYVTPQGTTGIHRTHDALRFLYARPLR